MSFFTSSRSVLVLSDEGLKVFYVKSRSTKLIDVIPWDDPSFEISAKNLIVKSCKKAPVVVLNDMVEQHYRKEKIPKVSFFDRKAVLKRRLGLAFPNSKVRAALKLKNKGASKAKDGTPFLFAGMSSSGAFNKTLSAVKLSGANLIGFFLLPIEASGLIKDISSKLNKNVGNKPVWKIFVGQHVGGGLRQVVTRDDELALTRITPIVDTDSDPALWSKEVSLEIEATMTYLSRFGYNAMDGLDVIVIANDDSKEALQNVVNVECDLHVINAAEAARLLKLNIGKQEDLRYADILHVSYLGRSRKFKLPLEAPSISEVVNPKKIASIASLGLFLGAVYLSYVSFQGWAKVLENKEQLVLAQKNQQSLAQELDIELEKIKAFGFDLKFVTKSLEIHNKYDQSKMMPLPVVQAISQSLGVDTRLDSFDLKVDEALKTSQEFVAYGAKAESEFFIEGLLRLSFSSDIEPEINVLKMNQIEENLKQRLPDYEVEIIKQVADLSYTGNVSGSSGASENAVKPERYDAEIIIRGRLK